MRDVSLALYGRSKNNSVYIFPKISLYTLSFSKTENIIIKNHLESTFNIKAKLKYRKDEISFIIESNKNGTSTEEIAKTLNRSYWGIVDKLRRLKKLYYFTPLVYTCELKNI